MESHREKTWVCPKCQQQYPWNKKLNYCEQCGLQLAEYQAKTTQPPLPIENPQTEKPELNYNPGPIRLRRRGKWNFFAGIWLPIATFGVIFVCQIIIMLIDLSITDTMVQTPFLNFILGGFSLFFLLSAVWKIQPYSSGKLTFRERMGELGLPAKKYSNKNLTREILLGILIGIAMVFIATVLQIVGAWLVENIFGLNIYVILENAQFEEYMLQPPASFVELCLFLLTMLLFIGVPEEIMFRGFVQRSFETKLSKRAALLLTAIYFSLFHILLLIIYPAVFFFLFLTYLGISIILGLVRNWRGDLYACVAAHIVYNIIQTLLIYIIFN